MSYLNIPKSHKKGVEKFSSDDYVPKRFGIRYDPPLIIMEYMIISTGKLYHHKMKLLNFTNTSNVKEMCDYLYKKHDKYLGNGAVDKDQIIGLIEKIKKKLSNSNQLKPFAINQNLNNKQGMAGSLARYFFNQFYESKTDIYDQYKNIDLNKFDDAELNKAKNKMDILFKQNSLRPGDPGYKYDVEEDFEPYEENEWDESEEDII